MSLRKRESFSVQCIKVYHLDVDKFSINKFQTVKKLLDVNVKFCSAYILHEINIQPLLSYIKKSNYNPHLSECKEILTISKIVAFYRI